MFEEISEGSLPFAAQCCMHRRSLCCASCPQARRWRRCKSCRARTPGVRTTRSRAPSLLGLAWRTRTLHCSTTNTDNCLCLCRRKTHTHTPRLTASSGHRRHHKHCHHVRRQHQHHHHHCIFICLIHAKFYRNNVHEHD